MDEFIYEPLKVDEVEEKDEAELLKGLNPEQVEAVKCLNGPLLVMAGAGSGKTRVLTYRIANLLAHNVPPNKILAITFTNKAANEMKERAEKMIGERAKKVWLSTFHSFCARILRQEIEATGIYKKNYVIYDSSDSQAVVKSCIKQLELNNDRFKGAVARISDAKNNLIDAAHFREMVYKNRESGDYDKNVAAIYTLYEKTLIENNALDFDDLIFVTVKILRDHPEIREKYQNRFDYLLIDEYQDTNTAQYILTKYLAERHRNICVVGDADQSIYGWRGADMNNILNFEKDYKDAKVIKLEQNYRSTKQILKAANAVISHNKRRKEKNLWTDNEEGEKIQFVQCIDDKSEAKLVTREIKKLVESGNYRYNEIAVLYRTNAQSRVFEEFFFHASIPYIIIGGLKFYERKEIKDMLAYLRLIYNPRDNISLLRIINIPRRGIGSVYMNRVVEYAEKNDISIFEAISNEEHLRNISPLPIKIKNVFRNFAAMIISFYELQKRVSLKDMINNLLETSGYKGMLTEDGEGDKAENIARMENLSSFVNSAADFESINSAATLEDFLNHVALITDIDSMDEEDSRVSLMTVHSAKGLEFPIVFVTGMEEGIFPHSNAMASDAEYEEERRACYVAMTRAKEKLYMSSATERMTFGKPARSNMSEFTSSSVTAISSAFVSACLEEAVVFVVVFLAVDFLGLAIVITS